MRLTLTESRRWTGPNLLSARPGAVIDAAVEGVESGEVIACWHREARRMLDALGWPGETLHSRAVRGGVMLAISAPIDALYSATEINEWAFEAAAGALHGRAVASLESGAEHLRGLIAAEQNAALMALRRAAHERRVALLSDDDQVSIGLGSGSRTWPVSEIPDPADVPWADVHDVPVALVTGTNGKTTTVRMLGAIARACGRRAGMTSTDGIVVDGEIVEAGDYSGPGGGRRLLRDPRVELAILETARGGMLRRGLTVVGAEAAAVTNVAEDHLGEFGVHDAAALAEVKLIVARAIRAPGALVLNADEPLLRERAPERAQAPPAWFSVAEPGDAPTRTTLDGAVRAGVFSQGRLIVMEKGVEPWGLHAAEIPATFEGAARHNVANALAAMLVARSLGLPEEAVRAGLRGFDSTAEGNPGRGNARTIGGVHVIVDFAHNPHGMSAMVDLVHALPARRRHLVLGQAGDRDDASIRALVRAAWRLAPARVVIKDMTSYLRGRDEGEVPALIESELRALGAGDEMLSHARGELEAAREAMRGAAEGDLVLMLVHSDRQSIVEWLGHLEQSGWQAGVPLEAHP